MEKVFIESKDVDEVITELCDPAQYQGYLQTMSHFVNRYSWRNIFLIYSKLPHASMLADYNRWKKEHGRTIIRNSTGIKINAPVEQEPKTKLVAKLNPDTGQVMLDENGKKIMEETTIPMPPKFVSLNLFDVSQTEGNPTHRLAGDVTAVESLHHAFVDILCAMLPTSELLDTDNDTAFDIWKVVKHITHERLASLDIAGANAFDFIVESVSFVVCRRFGVDVDMAGIAPNDIGIADMLEIISKQASSLITAIEDRFIFLCKKFSKGMKQRLVLARAMLNRPKILFLDEPTSGLDPSTAIEIHKLMLEMKNSGTTFFLTTHNMAEASKLCDRIALFNEGVIVDMGTLDELSLKYNDEKRVKMRLSSGEEVIVPLDAENSQLIAGYIESGNVATMHTQEPTLEDIFIRLTGRELT